MNTTEDLEHLAGSIFIGGIKREQLERDWEYRKNKTFADFKAAFHKGVMKGRGKFEHEIREAASAIGEVIVKKEVTHERTTAPSKPSAS